MENTQVGQTSSNGTVQYSTEMAQKEKIATAVANSRAQHRELIDLGQNTPSEPKLLLLVAVIGQKLNPVGNGVVVQHSELRVVTPTKFNFRLRFTVMHVL